MAVVQATANYLENENAFGRWLEECCFVGVNTQDTAARLYESWKEWAEAGDWHVGSLREFGDQLEMHGFERKKGAGGIRLHVGLKVLK
jgi:putative DNA primase/helicase